MATTDNIMNADEKMRMLIHDVRNPLSTIYLAIDSLKYAKAEGEDPEFYLELLEKSAKKIEEVLNDFRADVSEEENGKE